MAENLFQVPYMKDQIVEEMKLSSALKHRFIYLTEDVDLDACFKLNYYLDRIVRLDEKNGIKEPITIDISSFGGSIYDGLSSISRIEKMIEDGYEIISIIDAYAMSMGSAISQVCSKRYARRYTTILYHQPSSYAVGTLSEMRTQFNETQRLWNLMKYITKKHTKMTEEYLESMFNNNKDVYITAEEALELGIIDEII